MKILFLDDDPIRHKRFQIAHIGKDVTYVKTAKAAIEALQNHQFKHISLDHDLDETKNMELPPVGEGSGYDVALFIAKMKEGIPELVIIHSFNPAGAFRMRSVLVKAGIHAMRVPFSY